MNLLKTFNLYYWYGIPSYSLVNLKKNLIWSNIEIFWQFEIIFLLFFPRATFQKTISQEATSRRLGWAFWGLQAVMEG